MGDIEQRRYYNYTVPIAGKARAVTIADGTSAKKVDLAHFFPTDWAEGEMFSMRCDQDFRAQLSTSATATIVVTTTAPDATVDDEEAFLFKADVEYRFVTPPKHQYLHVRAAAAGTLWIGITSCKRTG